MDPILNQLDSDEAILLMYLAEELSAADRAEVEQRLAADAAFAARLQELRRAQEIFQDSLRDTDNSQPVSGAASAISQRKLSRMMAQWQVDRARRSAVPAEVRRTRSLNLGWWIPITAAAALFLGFIVWWDLQLDRWTHLTPDQTAAAESPLEDDNARLNDVDRELQTVAVFRSFGELQEDQVTQ
jgi:anti-sigma-K factor RskA